LDTVIDFERVIPTAWGVAFRRTFTDIPLSVEIFKELDRLLCGPSDRVKLEKIKRPQLTPFFEARYLLTDKLCHENQTSQYLELAAGFSQRGILFTKDPSVTYIEIDLPTVMADKVQIIHRLINCFKMASGQNLHLLGSDLLRPVAYIAARQHFVAKSVTVLNEGLLRYMSFDNKAIIAEQVHQLLSRFGGVWITPDITLPKELEGREEQAKASTEMTGIDTSLNAFHDVDHAVWFFKKMGFEVEVRSFREVFGQLVSPGRLGISQEEVEKTVGWRVAFVMRPR